jgi:branched-chain amino acid transport system permease protein
MEQIILYTLLSSAIIALVALGFTMIFGVAGVLNLAHGAFIMVGAYAGYVSHFLFKLDSVASLAIAIGFTALLAVAFYEGLSRLGRPILALSAGGGVAAALVNLLGVSQIVALPLGLIIAAAAFWMARRPEGLIGITTIVIVGYLGFLFYLARMPVLPAGLLATLGVVLFLWLALQKTILRGEHAIFFPIVTAVVAWSHFALHKPILEAFFAGIPLGLLFAAGLVRYIQHSPVITLIVTLACALLMQQLAIVFFGVTVLPAPHLSEHTINVHKDSMGLTLALSQAVFVTLLLGFWAYQLFGDHPQRKEVQRVLGLGVALLVIEHALTLFGVGRLDAPDALSVAQLLLFIALVSGAALAMYIYRVYRPNGAANARRSQLKRLFTAAGFGVGLLFEQVAFLYYAWDAQSIVQLFGNQRAQDLVLTVDRLGLFALSWIVVGLFWYFIQRTRTGQAILATSMDQEGAALVGIDVRRIYTITWAISGALAGLAGFALVAAGWTTILPFMWQDPLVVSFAIVVLGGLGSLKGSLVAAYIIGFAETFIAYTTPIRIQLSDNFFQYFDLFGLTWVGVPSLLILVLVLFVRPQGLFGRQFE